LELRRLTMSGRVTSTRCRGRASGSRGHEQPAPRGASRVLAERNQAVVAVGAWVEDGHDLEHPWVSRWETVSDDVVVNQWEELMSSICL